MMYDSAAEAFVAFGFALTAIVITSGISYLVILLIEWILHNRK